MFSTLLSQTFLYELKWIKLVLWKELCELKIAQGISSLLNRTMYL